MPVIRQERPLADRIRPLVATLAEEWGGISTPEGPVIFDLGNEVIVVWDAWDKLPNTDRASIIREAYAHYIRDRPSGEPSSDRIMTVLGATPEEAIEHGLLPYNVSSNLPPRSRRRAEVEEEMIRLGALRFGDRLELRFPTHTMAREAKDKLTELFKNRPKIQFQVGRIIGSVDDLAGR